MNYRFIIIIFASMILSISACSGGGGAAGTEPPVAPLPISTPTRSFYELTTGPYPENLTTKDGYLFWTEGGENPISKISISGGSSVHFASRMTKISDYYIVGQYLYWLDDQSLSNNIYYIKKTSLQDRSTVILTSIPKTPNLYIDIGMYADASGLYWIESVPIPNDPQWFHTTQSIKTMPLNGGDVVTLATTTVGIKYFTGDADNLYWMEFQFEDVFQTCNLNKLLKNGSGKTVLADSLAPTGKPAIYAGDIYLPLGGNLSKIPVSGGPIQTIYSYGGPVRGIAVDSTNIYWFDTMSVQSILKTGGTATTLAVGAAGPTEPYVLQIEGLTLHDNQVFWSERLTGSAGNIKSIPVNGGAVTTWEHVGYNCSILKSDSNGIYWLEHSYYDTFPPLRIAYVPTNSNTVSTLLTGIGGDWTPITINGDTIFIVDGEAIKKVPINGGPLEIAVLEMPENMLTPAIDAITSDGTYLYWVAEAFGKENLRRMPLHGGAIQTLSDSFYCNSNGYVGNVMLFNGRYLYCVQFKNGDNELSRISIDNGSVAKITPHFGGVNSDWIADDTNVYYTDISTGSLYKLLISDGTVTAMISNGLYNESTLASDNQYLYLIHSWGLAKMPISGGQKETILLQQINEGYGFMVDDKSIYWSYSDGVTGAIYMATPK